MNEIVILDKHEFLNKSWIGAGMITEGATNNQQMGFRIMDKDGKAVISVDLDFENVLILAGCLIKASHIYLELKEQKIK